MAKMNIMAEMRHAKLERIRANQATPPPSHPTPSPAPRVEVVEPNQVAAAAQKTREKEVKDLKVVLDPKVNLETEVVSGSKGVSDPKATLDPEKNLQETILDAKPVVDQDNKGVHPSIWDDHSVLGKGSIRKIVDDWIDSEDDVAIFGSENPIALTRQFTRKGLQIASAARHLEEFFVPTFKKVAEDLKKVEDLKKAEEDLLAALQKAERFEEKNKKLEKESTKLEDDLKTIRQDLQNEIFFKGLADKEKKALQKKYKNLQS
ncbi:putative laminin subunit beta-4 isoform X1 [Sesbania bispinosa]|nr:putative laminin subunit beta-4 isoform X1 [Sesbania bispinosa]